MSQYDNMQVAKPSEKHSQKCTEKGNQKTTKNISKKRTHKIDPIPILVQLEKELSRVNKEWEKYIESKNVNLIMRTQGYIDGLLYTRERLQELLKP